MNGDPSVPVPLTPKAERRRRGSAVSLRSCRWSCACTPVSGGRRRRPTRSSPAATYPVSRSRCSTTSTSASSRAPARRVPRLEGGAPGAPTGSPAARAWTTRRAATRPRSAACSTARSGRPGRLPRDPRALCAQRRGRLGRPRRARACDPERDAVSLRRRLPAPRRGGNRANRDESHRAMTAFSWLLVAGTTLIWVAMAGAVAWRARLVTRR